MMLVFVAIFAIYSATAYELNKCGLNTFETGNGVCEDCLVGLGVTCKECTS